MAATDDLPAPVTPPSRRPEHVQDTFALIEELTSDAGLVQHQILTQILAQNSKTEYLRNLVAEASAAGDLDRHIDLDALLEPHVFKRIAPLTTYEDVHPYIQRIADGDRTPILTAHPVIELIRSSGTSSGNQKLFPTIEGDLERRKVCTIGSAYVLHRDFDGLADGKEAHFLFARPEGWTAGGVRMQSLVASHWRSPMMSQHVRARHASPIEVVLECEDAAQSTYCQLLCALVRREEVVWVGALFASGMLRVIQVLQKKWRELVNDIHLGRPNEQEVADQALRNAVEARMGGPDSVLAMQVEEECCREPTWQGIIRRLWPRAKYVSCAMTGSMEQYIPALQLFAGGLPLVATMYAASECLFGINLSPLCSPHKVSYTFLPNMAYFEFLPLDAATDRASLDQSHLVDLADVKLGQEYEIVITTFAGLYRFQVGDVVEVTGFHNKAPQFHLVGRKNVVLSIDVDKTDEVTLQKAVYAAKTKHLETEDCGYQLVDYTSYTDISTVPAHYVLFWEISCHTGSMPDSSVFKACCSTTEECLDRMYKMGRNSNWIGPLEIRVVRLGTFQALMDLHVARGVSITQYKTPRGLKHSPAIDLLNSCVSHSFTSPKLPS